MCKGTNFSDNGQEESVYHLLFFVNKRIDDGI